MPKRPAPLAAVAAALSALCLTGVVAAPVTPAAAKPPSAAAKRKAQRVQLRAKLASVKQKKRATLQKLKQAKRSEETILADLRSVEQRLRATRARVAASKRHLRQAREQQRRVKLALAASQKRLNDRETALGRRMAANYRQGPVRYASVLLGSRSMGEMVSRAHVVRTVMAYDAQLIARIKADRLEVVRWKKEADAKAAEIAASVAELGQREADVTRDTLRRREVLAEARARRAEIENQLDALDDDSDNIAARLRALQETAGGRVRRLIPFTGGFVRPVDAPVTSRFGMRFHPILRRSRLHAGVDMPASSGTPIAAAAGGVVVFSGTMRGYGNVIVVDHGGSVTTLYAHCSQLMVSEGQSVAQGQMIGRVGATGLATGPHLHFEVRRGGVPVDPLGAF